MADQKEILNAAEDMRKIANSVSLLSENAASLTKIYSQTEKQLSKSALVMEKIEARINTENENNEDIRNNLKEWSSIIKSYADDIQNVLGEVRMLIENFESSLPDITQKLPDAIKQFREAVAVFNKNQSAIEDILKNQEPKAALLDSFKELLDKLTPIISAGTIGENTSNLIREMEEISKAIAKLEKFLKNQEKNDTSLKEFITETVTQSVNDIKNEIFVYLDDCFNPENRGALQDDMPPFLKQLIESGGRTESDFWKANKYIALNNPIMVSKRTWNNDLRIIVRSINNVDKAKEEGSYTLLHLNGEGYNNKGAAKNYNDCQYTPVEKWKFWGGEGGVKIAESIATKANSVAITSKADNKNDAICSKDAPEENHPEEADAEKRDCLNCMVLKREECIGNNSPETCDDFKPIPNISKEERANWPKEFRGPYGP